MCFIFFFGFGFSRGFGGRGLIPWRGEIVASDEFRTG